MNEVNKKIFWNFYKKMVNEYDRHLLDRGESWKTVNLPNFLFGFVNGTLRDNTEISLRENPSHLIDIASYCIMIHHRLTSEKGGLYD